MRKIIIGVVFVVVAVGAGVVYLFNNLDRLVKSAIETAGTEVMGSRVAVDGVAIDLFGGTASITGFSIANPPGFSNQAMMSFDEFAVAIDLASLNTDVIRINSITARNPRVLYETTSAGNNLDVVRDRLASDEPSPPPSEYSGPLLAIASIDIEGIGGTLQSHILPRSVEVNLGDIRLRDLQGTPEQIAEQAMNPLMRQLGTSAANSLVVAARDLLGQDAEQALRQLQGRASEQAQQLQERAREEVQGLRDAANERLDEAVGEELRQSLRGLLPGN